MPPKLNNMHTLSPFTVAVVEQFMKTKDHFLEYVNYSGSQAVQTLTYLAMCVSQILRQDDSPLFECAIVS